MSSFRVSASSEISSCAGPTGNSSAPGSATSSAALRRSRETGLSAADPISHEDAANAMLIPAMLAMRSQASASRTSESASSAVTTCHVPSPATTDVDRTTNRDEDASTVRSPSGSAASSEALPASASGKVSSATVPDGSMTATYWPGPGMSSSAVSPLVMAVTYCPSIPSSTRIWLSSTIRATWE